MTFLARFLGLDQFSNESVGLFRKYLSIRFIATITRNLSDTIYMLFLIDQLGYSQAAVIVSISMFVQMLIDYPSGSLGDWIGQKWVLITSFICFSIAYVLLFTSTSFIGFTFMAVFEGIGRAQASGALESWLDNNFQEFEDIDLDPERKNYGFTMSRLFTVFVLFLSFVYSTGGYIADAMSRRFVFLLQAALSTITIFVIYLLMKKDGTEKKEEKEKKAYITYFKEGLSFLVSSKAAFFYFIGMSIFYAVWSLWLSLLAFPIFYAYTGSNTYTSLVRSIGFIGGVIIQIYTSKLSKRIDNKYFPYFMIGHGLYYIAFIIMIFFIPFNYQFNIIIFGILVFFELFFNMSIWPIASTLYNRIMLDFIPSENRNSIYSLLPTIQNIIIIPLLLFAGIVIERTGLLEGTILAAIVALISSVFLLIATKTHYK
ncbi:MAG: MFS transporter [Candidatus Heimdallarchaeota archaeon]|nr:MFS transporter [Candidatus Heimdallarchaeota archaeon]